jgi:predicted enzyme related to lactoylglutathione lyase
MAALVVFSVDVRRLAAFYEAVLGADATSESAGDIRIVNDREEVVIHSIPEKIATTITVRVPPTAREDTPIKPIFDVASLETALDHVRAKGGVVLDRTFTLDGLTRHDVLDPEGNVVQLRSPAAPPR